VALSLQWRIRIMAVAVLNTFQAKTRSVVRGLHILVYQVVWSLINGMLIT